MSAEESLQKQLFEVKRRLGILEVQLAKFGDLHAPAHLITQIEDAQATINELEKALGVPPTIFQQAKKRKNPLYQRYLRRLVEQVGTLNLALISPEQARGIYLEEVYVDSPTPLSISVKVKDWQVIDWWLSRPGENYRERLDEKVALPRPKPEEMGYERAPLEALLGEVDERIAQYRKANPNKKPSERQNDWNNGVKENIIHLHLNHLAAARNRLVILGAPGSGKSTFVRYLTMCLAGAGIDGWTREVNLSNLENWPHGVLTPVYVELRRFVTSEYFPKSGGVTAENLWNYISKELVGEELQAYATDLRNDLEQGYALLILDGLDEVPYEEGQLKERQTQLSGLAQSLQTRFGSSRIIVTSRPYAYEGWNLPGFEAVSITEFEDEHRQELSKRLYQASGLSEETAQTKTVALNQQLAKIDRELKDRPLFVTLMATLYLKGGEGGLPAKKGTLYRESILLLLDRWTRSRPGAPSLTELLGDKTVEELYGLLAGLAYAVHDSSKVGEQTAEIKEGLLLEYLRPLGKYRREVIASYLCENAGVLVAPGQRGEEEIFHFAHRTFQEYLAAEELVKKCREKDSYQPVQAQLVGKPETWRVPCGFVGDVLADTGKKSELWLLLGDILEEETPQESTDPRWWLGWLGATIAQEQEICGLGKASRSNDKNTRKRLVEWLEAMLGTAQALPPVERAMCGRVLGLLGDTREGVGLDKKGLPDIYKSWCEIVTPVGGKFVMGEEGQYNNPRPEVELGYNYRMSKYLITYQQYQSFVDSGEYGQLEWWRDFPKEYQPQNLDQRYIKEDNRPRDNISWYQAVAFTRWLTLKYRAAGKIKAEEEIRLPTELEWEYAGRGSDERLYPYGNEFDATKGNTVETGIGSTSAVGNFPDGTSPFGVLDMSGNVWEWCLNKCYEPEQVQADSSDDTRVLRGGSYYVNSDVASCVYRNYFGYLPYLVFNGIGFRVVLVFSGL